MASVQKKTITLRLFICISETIQVTEGRMLASPDLKMRNYAIRLRRISNRTHNVLSCHVNTFLLKFNSIQFNLLTCKMRSAGPSKSQHKYINTQIRHNYTNNVIIIIIIIIMSLLLASRHICRLKLANNATHS